MTPTSLEPGGAGSLHSSGRGRPCGPGPARPWWVLGAWLTIALAWLAALPAHATPVTAPLLARWLTDRPLPVGRATTLRLRVVWQSPGVGALRMTLQAPPGLVVLQQPRNLPIQRPRSGEAVLQFVVRADRTQPGDLTVALDWQAADGGVHARSVQRFGRAAPRVDDPPRQASPRLPTGLPVHRAIPLATPPAPGRH
ncbi:MAG: hypothetical protein HY902_15560 [Deltaproteobacteria bacterium]|nr:hypothetical protein [Deltaproteobacteria bacterium]